MTSKEIIIYTAGLFDGEGTVSLSKSRENKYGFRYSSVSLSSTTPELIQFMKENFGGCICIQKKTKPNHSQSYNWRIGRNASLNFLITISPYIKEPSKIYRTNLIISEYKKLTPRNGRYSQEMILKKKDFESRFFNINPPSRGIHLIP